jgi:hypothetical protein
LALNIIHCWHIVLVVVVSGIDCCRIRSVGGGDCSRDGLGCVGLVRLAPTDYCRPNFAVAVMIGHSTLSIGGMNRIESNRNADIQKVGNEMRGLWKNRTTSNLGFDNVRPVLQIQYSK